MTVHDLFAVTPTRQRGASLVVKRCFDIVVGAAALALTAPIIAAGALAVRATVGRPVLFRQTRPGRHGVPFEIIKFRTMSDKRDAQGNLLPDAERLHAVGRFLRRSSIDELPQLWNVLKGDISLVGPRPLLMKYLPLYSSRQARRHDVLPGITGWAQVHGRNALAWEDKFELDVWYVDNWSLLLDAKILALTIARVWSGDGVSQVGHATMPDFAGTPSLQRRTA